MLASYLIITLAKKFI